MRCLLQVPSSAVCKGFPNVAGWAALKFVSQNMVPGSSRVNCVCSIALFARQGPLETASKLPVASTNIEHLTVNCRKLIYYYYLLLISTDVTQQGIESSSSFLAVIWCCWWPCVCRATVLCLCRTWDQEEVAAGKNGEKRKQRESILALFIPWCKECQKHSCSISHKMKNK